MSKRQFCDKLLLYKSHLDKNISSLKTEGFRQVHVVYMTVSKYLFPGDSQGLDNPFIS